MTDPAAGRDFIFAGYLIQEPYWRNWPRREGFRVASIEREIHPKYDKHKWNLVDGIRNPTKFLTEFPHIETLPLEPHTCRSGLHEQSPGWVVNGYSFPTDKAKEIVLTSTDGREQHKLFEYAFHLHRGPDELVPLGYEVVDLDIGFPFLSILNNCGYTFEQIREMAGPLNQYSLFGSPGESDVFIQTIRRDPKNPELIPNHNNGVEVQVWGAP